MCKWNSPVSGMIIKLCMRICVQLWLHECRVRQCAAMAKAYGTKVPAHNARDCFHSTSFRHTQNVPYSDSTRFGRHIDGHMFWCYSVNWPPSPNRQHEFYPNINGTVGAKLRHSNTDMWIACGFDEHTIAECYASIIKASSSTTAVARKIRPHQIEWSVTETKNARGKTIFAARKQEPDLS